MSKQELVGKEVFVCDDTKSLDSFCFHQIIGVFSSVVYTYGPEYTYFCLPSYITTGDPRDWPWKSVEGVEDE
jgi:hypothetical protein